MNHPMTKKLQSEKNVPKIKKSITNVTDEIEKLKQRRDDRKKKTEDDKHLKAFEEGNGKSADLQFEKLMAKKKIGLSLVSQPYSYPETSKIVVCVRKRPISKKELLLGEIDCASVSNPRILIHECKVKVDGITKYIDDNDFTFDNSFNENSSTDDLFKSSILPSISIILNFGNVTVFAYGQTGSGKTFTMKGIQNQAIEALFKTIDRSQCELFISFYEIYGGRLYDLLNGKNKLNVLEDKNQKVQIFGLEEIQVNSPDEMKEIIDEANGIRTTHNTVTNETSSRSHAVCNIILKDKKNETRVGKLTLVDLAGSERAQETQSNDKQRRAEGAEINKSLLALKECIRALDSNKNGSDNHVPFRSSKLTLVLRDSFINKADKTKIVMLACISPVYSSANHTINTLRYSDRLKEKSKGHIPTSLLNVHSNPIQKQNYINPVNSNRKEETKNQYSPDSHSNDKSEILEVLDISVNNSWLKTEEKKEELTVEKSEMESKSKSEIPECIDIIGSFAKINTNEQEDIEESIKQEIEPEAQPKKLLGLTSLLREVNTAVSSVNKVEKKEENDDFLQYHKITEKLIEDEENIMAKHISTIRSSTKALDEEGKLFTKVRREGTENNYTMEDYTLKITKLTKAKMEEYNSLLDKILMYKAHLKQEREISKRLSSKPKSKVGKTG